MLFRLHRILLEPTPEPGGGGSNITTTTPTPTPTSTTTQTTQATVKPPEVSLPWEEAQRLFAAQRRVSEIEAENAKKLADKEADRLRILAEKEGADRALTEQRTKYEGTISGLQSAFNNALTLTELANATAGINFVNPAAATQARDIMAQRLEVRQDGEKLNIVDKATGRPAAEAVKTWLASDEFAHFQKASTTGGSGAGGSNVTQNQTTTDDPTKGLKWADLAILKAASQVSAPESNPYSPTALRSRVSRN